MQTCCKRKSHAVGVRRRRISERRSNRCIVDSWIYRSLRSSTGPCFLRWYENQNYNGSRPRVLTRTLFAFYTVWRVMELSNYQYGTHVLGSNRKPNESESITLPCTNFPSLLREHREGKTTRLKVQLPTHVVTTKLMRYPTSTSSPLLGFANGDGIHRSTASSYSVNRPINMIFLSSLLQKYAKTQLRRELPFRFHAFLLSTSGFFVALSAIRFFASTL